ncbi:MAG: hypothetical protein KAW01_00760 [Deltaproteobacteria bacterium]|nr:hypothetical protein [Deltaproteobacteria bacterium]
MINIDKQNIIEQGEEFFATLFGDLLNRNIGEIEIRVFPTGYPEQHFFKNHRDALEKAYELCNSGIDVYFGVNPRIGGKGRKENIHYVTTFHAEIDYGQDGHKKTSTHGGYDQALATINDYQVKPTIVVHSGGGFHCYWVVKEPLSVEEYGVDAIETVNKSLSSQLGGDPGTQDISRILRIPGTRNFKLTNNPRPVEIIYLDGPKYDGQKMMELFATHDIADTGKVDEGINNQAEDHVETMTVINDEPSSPIDIDSLHVSPTIKSLIKNGNNGRYISRSEADMAVIVALVNTCVSEKIIERIFQNYPIGEKYREHNAPDSYLQYSINRAKDLSDLTDEERENPLFLSCAILKNGKKYHLDVVNFQELMSSHHQLKYTEDGSCFVRYNGKCFDFLTNETLNYLCQTELGQYRRLFSKNALRDFVHYGSGSEFYKSEKSAADMSRYLTMGNGLYDLENYELIPHSPDIFTTNLLPYDYDPEATCPRWLQFLGEIIAQQTTSLEFIYPITKNIPDNIKKDLEIACSLHQRAVSDYSQCMEFNKVMSNVLVQLEDSQCLKVADKVMTILINCNPKEGAHCDKSMLVGEKMKKF